MLHKLNLKIAMLITTVVVIFTACKKDPFSEKDALTAQQNLLQMQGSFQVQIAQINAAASRSHDSALIAIQNLVNSGATALAILQAQQQLAYLMQQYQNQLAMMKYQDSLNAARAVISARANYTVRVTDAVSNSAISGATVSVLPYNSATVLTATTDGSGVANFNQINVDGNAFFYVSKTSYSTSLIKANAVSGGAGVTLWNNGNAQNTVSGQIVADLDLTNGDAIEGVALQLVTFNLSYNGQVSQFPIVTDVNGKYTINLPDAPSGSNYTANVANQITVNQKMFVHYLQGQNVNTTVPHIDSVSTTLNLGFPTGSLSYLNQSYSFASYSFIGVAQMNYYYSFPNDVNGKSVWAGTSVPFVTNGNSFGGFFANWFNFNYTTSGSLNPTSWSDTLNYNTTPNVTGLNNGIGGQINGSYYSSLNDPWNYTYKPASGSAPARIPVTMVDIKGNIITSAPNLVANIDPVSGKIINIQLKDITFTPSGGSPVTQALPGSGGVFAKRTATNRNLDQNLMGLVTQAFNNNTVLNGSIFSVQGGQSKVMNFNYSGLQSRALMVY